MTETLMTERWQRGLLLACWFLMTASAVNAEAPPGSEEVSRIVGQPVALEIVPDRIDLSEPRASQQILVTGRYSDGTRRDLTRVCELQAAHPNLLHVTPQGLVSSRSDGETHLDIRAAGLQVRVPVSIRNSKRQQPISFRREFMPVLSAAGCADIRCHGAPSGKDGFRLSLWGHDPDLDFEQLTRNASARRTNSLDPNNSLILNKALGRVPHVGGRRFDPESRFSKLFHDWQAEGLHDDPKPVRVQSLTVLPTTRVLRAPARWQQLAVRAVFDDGHSADVTHLTTFSSTDLAIAAVDRTGLVEFNRQGEVAILCRFCGKMESVRLMHITVPSSDFRWPDPAENNFVDTHVFSKLKMLNMAPSELCTDQVFVRRVYLDVCGILPTVVETQSFIAATAPDKRDRLIEQLLQRPEYADYWTKKWMDVLRVSRDSIQLAGARAYHKWLRSRIEADASFDQIARDLLTSAGESYKDPAVNFYCVPPQPEKVTDPLFLQKDLAEATAQLFLGIRLQCAQCHNHPYERWTQNDYLALAAFFTQVKRTRLGKAGRKGRPDRRQMAIALDFGSAEITDATNGQTVAPGFPGEPPIDFDPKLDRRPLLAAWLTHKDNAYFAKAVVNRIWFHLHGRGIVEPVDDFRDSNPSANDPLLDALAEDFVANGYRLKPLIRTIINSRAWQLSSRPNASNRNDTRYFSHMLARPLPAEVLLDAVSSVTGIPEMFEITEDYIEGIPAGTVKLPAGTRAVQLPVNDVATLINTEGKYVRYELHPFLRVMGQPNRTETCECAREPNFGRKQALEMFVGRMITDRLTRTDNRLGQMLQDNKTDAAILRELYACALSREPSPSAAEGFLAHVANSGDRRQAWEDILWTVLNSQEFIYQH
jgi:hypothetical protein